MGEWDRLLGISKSKNTAFNYAANMIDFRTELSDGPKMLAQIIHRDLEAQGIVLDKSEGPLNKNGMFSLIFRSASVPGAVVRLGEMDNPADSAILLRPLARLIYKTPATVPEDDAWENQVHILPFAPDRERVTDNDILNTIRVLQAEGLADNLVDITPAQFVYLVDANGDYLRYPDNVRNAKGETDAMSGQRIAFIRDLNALPQDLKTAQKCEGMGGAEHYLSLQGIKREDLTAAPALCVAACAQQEAIGAKIKQSFLAQGVDLDKLKAAAASPAVSPPRNQPGAGPANRL